MAYPTVDELKAYLTVDDSIVADDTLLGDCLDDAQAYIEGETGRRFEVAADTTRYYDCISHEQGGPVCGADLLLGSDLCRVASVTNGDGSVLAAGSYALWPYNETPASVIRLYADSGTTWTFSTRQERSISVAGRWGYSTEAPDDVRRACMELAAALYRRRAVGGIEQDRAIVADGYVIQAADIPVITRRVITRYRKVSL